MSKWQLNFHFLQPNTLVYLVYSVVTWFSKWQHVRVIKMNSEYCFRYFVTIFNGKMIDYSKNIISDLDFQKFTKSLFQNFLTFAMIKCFFYFLTEWYFQSNFIFFSQWLTFLKNYYKQYFRFLLPQCSTLFLLLFISWLVLYLSIPISD